MTPELMSGPPPFGAGSLVTLDAWQDPPGNRWAFQHVRELIPTARIRHGRGPAWPLERDEQPIGALRFDVSGGRSMTVSELLDESYTDGFLVLHGDRIVAEEYRNHMEEDTPHLLMSVSKSVTAAVAGVLVHKGLLDVGAKVTDVVPELLGTSFDGATVQHLLDMRAGTKFNEDYDDLDADVRVYEQLYLWRPRTDAGLPADAIAYFATLHNDGEHGGPFRYRSILTDALGWVLERAGGQRFHELVSRELWQPLGAEHDADVTLDGHGNAMADGGVSATLRDLGRFGLLHLRGGTSGTGAQLFDHTWTDDIISGAEDGARAFVEGDNPPGFPAGSHYRNCWWVRDPVAGLYHASGIYGQNVMVHVPTETVVVKFSTWPTAIDRSQTGALAAATVAIGNALAADGRPAGRQSPPSPRAGQSSQPPRPHSNGSGGPGGSGGSGGSSGPNREPEG
jgi:CubicO group peptidase (beta-lactamase class C family)